MLPASTRALRAGNLELKTVITVDRATARSGLKRYPGGSATTGADGWIQGTTRIVALSARIRSPTQAILLASRPTISTTTGRIGQFVTNIKLLFPYGKDKFSAAVPAIEYLIAHTFLPQCLFSPGYIRMTVLHEMLTAQYIIVSPSGWSGGLDIRRIR